MNLNEECLLQFLRNDLLGVKQRHVQASEGDGLTADLRRILRRTRYVSFPQAILIRRTEQYDQIYERV